MPAPASSVGTCSERSSHGAASIKKTRSVTAFFSRCGSLARQALSLQSLAILMKCFLGCFVFKHCLRGIDAPRLVARFLFFNRARFGRSK